MSQPELDMTKPIIRRKGLAARSVAGMKTVIDCGDFGEFAIDEPAPAGTGTGPSPLQAVMGAVCGCIAITLRRVADEMSFRYDGIEFGAEFVIDIRGRLGMAGVKPYFQEVHITATVHTTESDERLSAVAHTALKRSPTFNLIKDAGTNVFVIWSCGATPAPAPR